MYVHSNKSIDVSTLDLRNEFRQKVARAVRSKHEKVTVQDITMETEYAQFLCSHLQNQN